MTPKVLVANRGTPEQRSLIFYERVEIGRDPQSGNVPMGRILVGDEAVSGKHCVVTQQRHGRCFVRDTSRNGTRLDGRRLVPNVESEILPGQVLSIGLQTELLLEHAEGVDGLDIESSPAAGATMRVQLEPVEVTVLIGDIHGYTTLVQKAPPRRLQDSVSRLFKSLEVEIRALGGMLKEYQGDAVFAYWESGPNPDHAVDACRAAVRLRHLVEESAADPEVWDVPGFPLAMDWAVATGEVLLEAIGGDSPIGLSMIGEAVVLAFRLEKLARGDGSDIVVSESTWTEAREVFELEDQGTAEVDGFDEPQRYFLLREGEPDDATEPL